MKHAVVMFCLALKRDLQHLVQIAKDQICTDTMHAVYGMCFSPNTEQEFAEAISLEVTQAKYQGQTSSTLPIILVEGYVRRKVKKLHITLSVAINIVAISTVLSSVFQGQDDVTSTQDLSITMCDPPSQPPIFCHNGKTFVTPVHFVLQHAWWHRLAGGMNLI